LLRALSPADLSLLVPHLEPVKLSLRERLQDPHDDLAYAYFIESGIGSMIARTSHRREAEIGLIGRDGMIGVDLAQGDSCSPYEFISQVEGWALRIPADKFTAALSWSMTLRMLCIRFARALAVQTAYTALVNAQSKLEDRLARWLLMIHDRIDEDRFETTHDFIAQMLAVRRPGVTVALHILEGKGLIRSNRGEVLIRDREGLIELSDGAYGQPEQEYERIMGFPVSDNSRIRKQELLQ